MTNKSPSTNYVDTNTAASMLDRHPVYIRVLIREKKIAAKKVMGQYRISIQEIERILEGE